MRRGVVLVVVLLLMVAVTLLALGSLRVALAFRGGAAEGWEAMRARRAAEAEVRAAMEGGDTLPAPWSAPDSGVETRRGAFRLSPEVLLVVGSSRAGPARWWVGGLMWGADPGVRGRDVAWAARVGGGLVLESSAGVDVRPGFACGVEGSPGRVGPLRPEGAGVGPIPLDALARKLPGWDPGARASCPEEGCPAEWGVVPGDVDLGAGLHQGLFVVLGDLRLTGDAELRGTVLVGGSLTLAGTARITGAVEVVGDLFVASGARIVGDPCAVVESWVGGPGQTLRGLPLDARPWPLWGLPP